MKKIEYFKVDAFSASKIKMYEDNHDMIHFINSKQFNDDDKDKMTEALFFGEVFHLAVLEPTAFMEKQDDILSQLTPAKRKSMSSMLMTMAQNKTAVKLIKDAKFVEFPLYAKYPLEHEGKNVEVWLKGYIDLYTNQKMLVDLKTVASLDNFYRQFKKYRYDLQLAIYKQLLESNKHEVKEVLLIAAEKVPPFGWQCFLIPEEELYCGQFGAGKYRGFKEIMTEMFYCPKSRFDDDVVTLESEEFQ